LDAKKEFGNLLSDRNSTVPELLRLVEIGELDNIAPEYVYVMWTKELVYTKKFLRIMLPRSDPPIRIRTCLLQDEERKDFVLNGLELRIKLPAFFKNRYDDLMEKLSPYLPKVLRHETIMLEQGSLSTDEMWETGLGDMTPQRRSELLTYLEVESAMVLP
jgi:hypothetical protein